MLNDNIKEIIKNLNEKTSYEEKIWIAGYYSGLTDIHNSTNQTINTALSDTAVINTEIVTPDYKVIVLYMTQSGNAKKVAIKLDTELNNSNISSEVKNVSEIKVKSLSNYTHIFFAVATYGDGEAPDTAIAFHKELHSKKAPDLSATQFAVFSLGDETYEKFCQTGIEIDEQLEKLGSKRLLDNVLSDTDFEDHIGNWTNDVKSKLQPENITQSGNTNAVGNNNQSNGKITNTTFDKNNPYRAEILNIFNLNDENSDRETFHIELDLDETGISYTAGDALGVISPNNNDEVNNILTATGLSGDENINFNDNKISLNDVLTNHLNITTPTKSSLEKLLGVEINDNNNHFLNNHTYAQIIQLNNIKLSAQELVDILPKLKPRLYSISSAMDEVGDEVHLTVGKASWNDYSGNPHLGQASGFLSKLSDEDSVNIYVHKNDAFRLPNDENTPIIMIGAGTGIAPFRSFIQQRSNNENTGENWLIFGNPTFENDFLYQTEWQDYIAKGVLSDIDLAFSRDQAEKVYVQNVLKQKSEQVAKWLDKGAHIYVCGATSMAKEVNKTLIEIIKDSKKISLDDATDELNSYTTIGRYQRDIY